jgi:hypothetical protein
MESMTPVLPILYTFSAVMAGSCNTFSIISNQCDGRGRLAGLIKGKLRAKYMRARDKL